MNSLLTTGTRVHSNYTNHVYEVPGTSAEDRYLLFNPSIHYWIAVSDWGATVARELDRADLRTLQDRLERRFGIGQLDFDRQVLPFVDSLLELGFFTLDEMPQSAGWVPDDFSLQQPERYPFNDLFVSLLDTCNLDCVYCFNKEDRAENVKRRPARKPSPETIVKAMSDFKALGGSGVCFTGGEPTLHPDFLDLCSAGKGIGLTTHFITNGTMLGRMDAERLMDAVDGFAVSLDTLDNEIAFRLWGTRRYDARREILEPLVTIANLAAARGKDLRINIKPIVSSVNSESLQPMVAEVSSRLPGRQVSWDFGRYERIGDPEIDRLFEISDDAYLQTMVGILETLFPELRSSAIPADGSWLGRFGHESVRAVLGHFGKLQPGRRVAVLPCIPSFFIATSGDVYPCQGLALDDFRLGSVADSTMGELFDHPAFAGLRGTMTVDDLEVCGDCELRYVCARHCHADAVKRRGRTTAFVHDDVEACRSRVVTQLWLETRDLAPAGTDRR